MMSRLKKWFTNILKQFEKYGFRILVGLALSIFAFFAVYKGCQYLWESRYAQKDIVQVSGIAIKVIYPSVLNIVPPEKARQQISIDMAGYFHKSDIWVKVDLSDSNGLLFQDIEGNITSSVIVLDASKAVNGDGIFVLPEPLLSDTQENASLNLKITVYQDVKQIGYTSRSYKIQTINASGGWAYYWLDPLLEEGLAISFSLALLGWAIDYRNKYKDEEKKDRSRKIQVLRETANSDPVEAMLKISIYLKENWEDSLVSELEPLQKQFESEEHFSKMLHLAGQALKNGDGNRYKAILSHFTNEGVLKLKKGDATRENLTIIQELACKNTTAPENKVESLINATLYLWDKYDIYAKEITVFVICHVSQYGQHLPFLKGKLQETPHRRALLREPRIKKIEDLERFSTTAAYEWEPVNVSSLVAENSSITKWLQDKSKHKFRFNPFNLSDKDVLFETFMPTEKWHNVMSVNSSVCAFRLERDRYFVVRYVESALQNNREKHPNLYVPEFNVFPIYLPLDIVNADSKTIPSIISIEVINAIAAAWTRLICKNPDSFHNLSEYDQHLLLEFFIWRFGSAYELQLWLKRYEMQEFSQRMFFEKVDEFSKKQSVKPDAVKKMNEWLTVKPPDLEYAHVLVDLQPTGNKKRDIQVVKQLLTLANSLRKTSIVLKIFTSPISGLREAATPIRWSAENLEKILNSCISRASDNSQLKFSELFWPVPNQNATDLLIKKSKGSLSELLRLGNEVLRIHVDNSPDEYYLDVSDVEKAK